MTSKVDKPRISIITPSFNQGRFIEQTILSVLNQNYPTLEYIVIDGGSTDNTLDILRKYDHRISHWISEPDSGQAEAINKGFRLASGEIIAWINSDDWYEPGAFHIVSHIFQEEGFDLLCGSADMVEEDGKLIQELVTPKIEFRTLLRYWKPHFCPPQPSIFIRRSVFEKLGPLSEELRYAMDFDYWLRATEHFRFRIIQEKLSYYRIHHTSKTGPDIGLHKFIPEWKTVISRELAKRQLSDKLRYSLECALQKLKGRI